MHWISAMLRIVPWSNNFSATKILCSNTFTNTIYSLRFYIFIFCLIVSTSPYISLFSPEGLDGLGDGLLFLQLMIKIKTFKVLEIFSSHQQRFLWVLIGFAMPLMWSLRFHTKYSSKSLQDIWQNHLTLFESFLPSFTVR